MSGNNPPGFPAPREVVLALPSQSEPFEEPGSSQASVGGPARATPSDHAWDGGNEDGQGDYREPSPGHDLWEQLEAEATHGDGQGDHGEPSPGHDMWEQPQSRSPLGPARANAPPAITYTPVALSSPHYTPATYSSSYSPATPSDYRPPPPATDQEILQRAEHILTSSRRVANRAYELNYSARRLVRVLRSRREDGEAGPSAPAGVQRRHGSRRTDDSGSHPSARQSRSRSQDD